MSPAQPAQDPSRSRRFVWQDVPWQGWAIGAGILVVSGSQVMRWLEPGLEIRDPDAMQGFVSTLAEVLAGILGFTISVVAIVVQLSADRFTPKVTELFLRERTNFLVIFFLIIANLISVWTTLAFSIVEESLGLVMINLILGTASFLVLIPYFRFVFNFLQPASIISKIEQQIRQSVLVAIAGSSTPANTSPTFHRSHQDCLAALDELKSIALSASQQRESQIVLGSLDSLKTFLIFYAGCKATLPEQWFWLTAAIYRDPDFVSVDGGKLAQIEAQRLWIELKVFRQYQAIFAESLNGWREACVLVAINSRHIAEKSLVQEKPEVVKLVITFFNTYLRAVINTRDVRTGYTILKQYRLIAEGSIRHNRPEFVLEIAQHFRYYSLIAYKGGLLFLCETLAFDLGVLIQVCYEQMPTLSQDLLAIFLKIDQDPESEQQEATLRGIRKSQVKLAAYYLKVDQDHWARQIFEDMQDEPPPRLVVIWNELKTTQADFWEFTDRGDNFYYVDPSLLPYVDQFFGWFQLPPSLPHE